MSEKKTSFWGIALVCYLIVSQIMTVIFFIDLCKEWDSVLKIVFLGPIWAEIKGILCFFFI